MDTVQTLSAADLAIFIRSMPRNRTVMIWGPPGIGKSDVVFQAAKVLSMPLVILMGTQLAPEDLIGIPRIVTVPMIDYNTGKPALDEDGRPMTVHASQFSPPVTLMVNEPFMLFCDEVNASSADVQKAFYSLILDRRLGEYKMPPGSIVVCAGNRDQDFALATEMASALKGRMVHVQMLPDVQDWLDWAGSDAPNPPIKPEILGYISSNFQNQENVLWVPYPTEDQDPEFSKTLAGWPTPRQWAILSDVLWSMPEFGTKKRVRSEHKRTDAADEASNLWLAAAVGSVGRAAGEAFMGWLEVARKASFTLEELVAAGVKSWEEGKPNPKLAAIGAKDRSILYYIAGQITSRLKSNVAEDGRLCADALYWLVASEPDSPRGATTVKAADVARWVLDAAYKMTETPATKKFKGECETDQELKKLVKFLSAQHQEFKSNPRRRRHRRWPKADW